MHKITNIYKKSTIIPNRTCNLFICDCKTQDDLGVNRSKLRLVTYLSFDYNSSFTVKMPNSAY